MPSRWKKLFMVAAALLAISLIICGVLGYQLNAAKTQLDVTKKQLATTKTELDDTKTQLDRTERERNQMLNHYSDLRKQINTRLGKGQDCQSFITPNDPAISAKVLEITGGYAQDVGYDQDVNECWRDYERLYRWVTANIKYTKDSHTPILPEIIDGNLTWKSDFWRMPTETLKDEAGDCEDMAALLASMLFNYNEGRVAVWVLGIQTGAPEYKQHLAVAFPVTGDKLAILDPAARYYTRRSRYSGRLWAHDADIVVDTWLSHWATDMPDAQIYVVFSDKLYREFSSTQEFIDWVRES